MTARTTAEAEYFAAIVARSAAAAALRAAQTRHRHGPRLRRITWVLLLIAVAAFAVLRAEPIFAVLIALGAYIAGALRPRTGDSFALEHALVEAGARMAEAEARVRAATEALSFELMGAAL